MLSRTHSDSPVEAFLAWSTHSDFGSTAWLAQWEQHWKQNHEHLATSENVQPIFRTRTVTYVLAMSYRLKGIIESQIPRNTYQNKNNTHCSQRICRTKLNTKGKKRPHSQGIHLSNSNKFLQSGFPASVLSVVVRSIPARPLHNKHICFEMASSALFFTWLQYLSRQINWWLLTLSSELCHRPRIDQAKIIKVKLDRTTQYAKLGLCKAGAATKTLWSYLSALENFGYIKLGLSL